MLAVIMILVSLIVTLAYSAPVITSAAASTTYIEGGTITITGTSFGVKSPAAPLLWDNFESGVNGNSVATPTIGSYDRISDNITYTTTGVYSGSLSTYEYFDGLYWSNGVVANWIPEVATKSFASMKVKFTSDTGSLELPASKLLRLNTWDPDATHGYPNFSIGLRGYSASLEIVTNIGAGWGDPGSIAIGSVGTTEFADPDGEWFGLSMWMLVGSLGADDGMAGREFNGSVVETAGINTLIDVSGLHDYNGTRSAYFNGHMGLYGSSSLESSIDEVYADTTFSRVVLAASNTWSSHGASAMQPPTTWSDTSITIGSFNQSAFAADDIVYLFVVDAEGGVSAGHQVIIGAAAGSSSPGQPTVTRTGDSSAISWTAASPAPTSYQIEIIEGTSLRRAAVQVDGATTSVTVQTSSSAALRTTIKAIDGSGAIQSTSQERYTAGS